MTGVERACEDPTALQAGSGSLPRLIGRGLGALAVAASMLSASISALVLINPAGGDVGIAAAAAAPPNGRIAFQAQVGRDGQVFTIKPDGAGLTQFLREHDVDAVEVCGIATDHCVRATALDAAQAGFTATVLLDLTAAVAPDRIETTLRQLAEAGVTVR